VVKREAVLPQVVVLASSVVVVEEMAVFVLPVACHNPHIPWHHSDLIAHNWRKLQMT
jgi:hypothetical protein